MMMEPLVAMVGMKTMKVIMMRMTMVMMVVMMAMMVSAAMLLMVREAMLTSQCCRRSDAVLDDPPQPAKAGFIEQPAPQERRHRPAHRVSVPAGSFGKHLLQQRFGVVPDSRVERGTRHVASDGTQRKSQC